MADARRVLAVAALTCALVLTGCTTDKPAAPTPSPSPASPTPTETAQERHERLDYAAAEKSYRTFRAEYNRVLRDGGSKTATPVMNATAGGDYLKQTLEVVQAYKGLHYKASGIETIVYVHGEGHSDGVLSLSTCEDGRRLFEINQAGKRTPIGELRQEALEVRRTPTGWKVWSGRGKKVNSCD